MNFRADNADNDESPRPNSSRDVTKIPWPLKFNSMTVGYMHKSFRFGFLAQAGLDENKKLEPKLI